MEVLVGVETVLLVVVGVLLVGVLRSHAELLRRLDSGDAIGGVAGATGASGPRLAEGVPAPPPARAVADAVDVAGTTLAGDAVKIASVARHSLVHHR